jgi:hypothetical protein
MMARFTDYKNGKPPTVILKIHPPLHRFPSDEAVNLF